MTTLTLTLMIIAGFGPDRIEVELGDERQEIEWLEELPHAQNRELREVCAPIDEIPPSLICP